MNGKEETYEEACTRYAQMVKEGRAMSAEQWFAIENHIPTMEERKADWDASPDEMKKLFVNPYEEEKRNATY